MNRVFVITGLMLMLLACSSGPEPIVYGTDQCSFCKMTIADPKFGAELVTDKGRILKYDAIECLIHHLQEDAPPHSQLLAIGFDTPEQLHPVSSLVFIISPEYPSPMGAHLAAFSDTSGISAKSNPDLIMRWEQVIDKLGR